MNDVIFITGCPTSGKSTISSLLQQKLQSPMFEFGWIPEFRLLEVDQKYEDEEKLSFENLNLVVKNYVKHGYSNIIITDIRDDLLKQVPTIYNEYSYKIFTLILSEEEIKFRIDKRKIEKNGFSNLQLAIKSNQFWSDSNFKNQTKIFAENMNPEKILNIILNQL